MPVQATGEPIRVANVDVIRQRLGVQHRAEPMAATGVFVVAERESERDLHGARIEHPRVALQGHGLRPADAANPALIASVASDARALLLPHTDHRPSSGRASAPASGERRVRDDRDQHDHGEDHGGVPTEPARKAPLVELASLVGPWDLGAAWSSAVSRQCGMDMVLLSRCVCRKQGCCAQPSSPMLRASEMESHGCRSVSPRRQGCIMDPPDSGSGEMHAGTHCRLTRQWPRSRHAPRRLPCGDRPGAGVPGGPPRGDRGGVGSSSATGRTADADGAQSAPAEPWRPGAPARRDRGRRCRCDRDRAGAPRPAGRARRPHARQPEHGVRAASARGGRTVRGYAHAALAARRHRDRGGRGAHRGRGRARVPG